MNEDEKEIQREQTSNSQTNVIEEVKFEPKNEDARRFEEQQEHLFQEQKRNHQRVLINQLYNQFRVVDQSFYFKDHDDKLAFKDKGERLFTSSNDDRVVHAMTTFAEAKGWQAIKVSGHQEFQRKVWMDASLRGIEVHGYQPTEQELDQLNKKLGRVQQNTIEKVPCSVPQNDQNIRAETTNEQTSYSSQTKTFERDPANNNKDVEPSVFLQQKDKEENQSTLTQEANQEEKRIYTGRVLDHGYANFNHDPNESKNYYVKLATEKGEKTIWGIDLKRAMLEGKANTNDNITLEFKGKEPIRVAVQDKTNEVTGYKWINTVRNAWKILKSDKSKVVEAVAAKLIDTNIENPQQREVLKKAVDARLREREKTNQMPIIPIYDKRAPAKSPTYDNPEPKIEHDLERTR